MKNLRMHVVVVSRIVMAAIITANIDYGTAQSFATTYTVNSAADNGAGGGTSGDLRYCVGQASAGDTINFSLPNPTTITLTQSQVDVSFGISIVGPGPDQLFINGTATHRILSYASGGASITAVVSGVTFTNGASGSLGGAIYVQGSGFPIPNPTLLVSNCVFVGNAAPAGGAIRNEGTLAIKDTVLRGNTSSSEGGAIDSFGDLTMERCTIADNQVVGPGGGIWNNQNATLTACTVSGNGATSDGGGIDNINGNLVVVNCTISSNQSATVGGGIANGDAFNSGVVTLNATTIAFNHANDGGGIGCISASGAAFTNIIDTIIASNTATLSTADASGAFTSVGHNLISVTNGSSGWLTNDLVEVDALLGPLQDNTGPTFTHLLLMGSPAIDAGDDNNCQGIDQRGVTRPQGAHCDIGAVEVTDCDLRALPPTITCSSNLIVVATFGAGATVTFTVTAGDSCTTNQPGIISDPPSGSVFGFGTNSVLSTATDTFSNLNSCSFTIVVQGPRSVLQDQIARLTTLLDVAPTGPEAKQLTKAITALTSGTISGDWATDAFPNERTGKKAFSAMNKSIGALLALIKKNGPNATLQNIIDQTVASARLAAQVGIENALAPKNITKANAAFTAGDAAVKPATAIRDYEKAWSDSNP
jgi:hypothetical protein